MAKLDTFLIKHNIQFHDKCLLTEALTHRSYTNEVTQTVADNQRLEYLGDAVLDLVINEYLYHRFPSYSEGNLAQLCSTLVCETALSRIASQIGLGDIIYLGKGEEKLGGRKRHSNLADCLEAFIAALYLDQGLAFAQKYILHWFRIEFNNIDNPHNSKDAKSILQEITQKYLHTPPLYEEVSHSGPAHHKSFTVRVIINGQKYGLGKGRTLKKAEQDAATQALKKAKKIEFTASNKN